MPPVYRLLASKGLRMIVGVGSRSQDELDDWDSKLVISSRVAGVTGNRWGDGDEWWAGVGEWLV